MSPDERSRRRLSSRRAPAVIGPRTGPSPDDVHDIVFFRRHVEDDEGRRIPGRESLNSFPPSVRAKMRATLVAVATAPPKRFSGGGYWEAMHGEMTGWFEVRADGPQRHHYRLYCLLDYAAQQRAKPLLVVVAGLDKPFRTVLTPSDYEGVSRLGEEYLRRNPRSLG